MTGLVIAPGVQFIVGYLYVAALRRFRRHWRDYESLAKTAARLYCAPRRAAGQSLGEQCERQARRVLMSNTAEVDDSRRPDLFASELRRRRGRCYSAAEANRNQQANSI